MTATLRTLALAGLTAAVLGCTPPYSWGGSWEGMIDASREPTDMYDQSMRKVKLTIGMSGDFVLTIQGFPISGDALSSGSILYLRPVKILDQSLERQNQQLRDSFSDLHATAVNQKAVELKWGLAPQNHVILQRIEQPEQKGNRK